MQTISDYVLANFFLVYEKAEGIDIAFGAGDSHAKIIIPDLSMGFFEEFNPFEISRVIYKPTEGESIPFLFAKPDCELFELEDGKVVFNDDLFSSAFYFLSGWQELLAPKDHLDRFTYEKSIQKQLGIAHLPVVNYYFKVLATAIEIAYDVKLKNKLHRQDAFVTCVTHDIDVWKNAWRNDFKQAFKQFDFNRLLKISISLISGNNLGTNFGMIRKLQEKYGFRSSFFFLPRQGKYSGEENADYEISKLKYQKIIWQLEQDGNEIALHGGFSTSFNVNEFKTDLKRMNIEGVDPIQSNRFHYLMYDLKQSTEIIDLQGITYDSTLGFNSMPGFRNGTSYPFFIYNYQTGGASHVIEIPLAMMDISVFSDNYLGCKNAEEGYIAIKPILLQIKKTGGCLVLNWHNNYFSELNYKEWQKLFEMILEYSKVNQADFKLLKKIL